MMPWLQILGGLLLLVAGGEALVRGAAGLALLARITPTVVGLTVVAAGTSAPELVVSLQSAAAGSPGLAVGNVVGSNLFNIGAIVGLTAIYRPLRILLISLRRDWPVMMMGTLVFVGVAYDGEIGRVDGLVLFGGLLAFVTAVVGADRAAHRRGQVEAAASGDAETASDETLVTADFGRAGLTALALNATAVAVGVGCLAGGSSWLVMGATTVAQAFGVSDAVIGLTVVAAGTSAPELMTSLVAAWRGRDDIAVANVIGSNIFNLLGIAGLTAIVLPLEVADELLRRDTWWLLGLSIAMLPIMASGRRVSRREGVVLAGALGVYLTLLALAARG